MRCSIEPRRGGVLERKKLTLEKKICAVLALQLETARHYLTIGKKRASIGVQMFNVICKPSPTLASLVFGEQAR